MDLATIGGLLVAFGAMLGAFFMDGGTIGGLISPSAFILVIGGTIGATMISFSMGKLVSVFRFVLSAFTGAKSDLPILVERLVQMAERARRDGILALEEELRPQDDPLLAWSMRLAVDGMDPEDLRSLVESRIALTQAEDRLAAGVLDTAGGYAPTMGIIGTVMGLVHVLSNLADADKLASSIAVAFLATFYGIFTANVLWLPLASKVKANATAKEIRAAMVLEGVLSIQKGENLRLLREKLTLFIAPNGKPQPSGEPQPAEELSKAVR